jgi:putative transposase
MRLGLTACESFISTIKHELIKRRSWASRDQARLAVFSYIETFYNPRRRHSALGCHSPIEYENKTQEPPATAAAA